MNVGIKHDDGKLPLGLIPPEALLAEAAVLRHGASKYGPHNWRKGIAYSRIIDAALRHITAWIGGEDLDAESGLPHLAHARCCLGFLIAYEVSGPRNDDRYRTMKHSRGAEDPSSVRDALRAEVKSMHTAIKAAAIEAIREATVPKVPGGG